MKYQIAEAASATDHYLTAGTSSMDIGGTRDYPAKLDRAEYITIRSYASGFGQHDFDDLVKKWKQETAKLSMVQKKALHPAYQRIIGMGKDALPLIFKELEREPDDWLWALTAITGKDDVAKLGSTLDEAIKEWLAWGKIHGYLVPKKDGRTRYTTAPS